MSSHYRHPRRWSEMSIDFKLMVILHASMIGVWMLGNRLTVQQQLIVAGVLLACATAVSIWRKRTAGWRWRAVGWKDILSALFGFALIVIFLGAATPLASPLDPLILPWFIAGANLGLFNILVALHLASFSEEEFLSDCREPGAERIEAATSPEENWKQALRTAFGAVFLAVWLAGLAFFYFFGLGMRDGSPAPSDTHSEALTNNGHTVFVTAQSKHLIDLLQLSMFVGVPAVMALGAILHFGLKIRVFGDR